MGSFGGTFLTTKIVVVFQKKKMAIYVLCNIEACWRNNCCSGKALIIIYSECVSVALFIQHAKRMSCTVLMTRTCLGVPYFSTLSLKGHDFLWKKILNIKCVPWFSLQVFSETFFTLRRIQPDAIVNIPRSSYKVKVKVSHNRPRWPKGFRVG